MVVLPNYSLKKHNTFGVDVTAKFFVEVNTVQELRELLLSNTYINEPKIVLGGGSNVLFTKNYDGVVVKNNIKGKELLKEDTDHYYVKAFAGENWHQFVLYCIEKGYAGIENMSLIPGNVGAGPIQNIGAYGVELKDVVFEIEALDLGSLQLKTFSNFDCKFGYRSSVFKNEFKGRYIIVAVTFCLNKTPNFNTSYGAINVELEKMGVKEKTIATISKAICNIRTSKLPDPEKMGNAGSFFKNPTISNIKFETLKNKFPEITGHKVSDSEVKLYAGWLIEKCGWKGRIIGNVGVHKEQALVIVNYGSGSGKEIFDLSKQILESVKNMFDIDMEREVNII